jgi:hypothetical protein
MSVIDPRTQKLKQQDDPNAPQQTSTAAPTSTNGGGGSSRTAAFSSGGGANKQGSGRFTNLQKYIDANEGAGQNIANRMGNAVVNSYGKFSQDFNNQVGNINNNIQQGNDLLTNKGDQYKSTLGNLSNELGTFNSMVDRDRFNTASQGLIDFNNQNGIDFNRMRMGQAIDEAGLETARKQADLLANNTIGNIQKQQQGIQTEAGRYDLLKQARPKMQGYTSGQGRLDQLFFQATPDAVNSLQQTYGTQLADARNKQNADLSGITAKIAELTARENDYKTNLQNLSNQAQDTFYNKLNQASNYDQVNDARTALYNDYVEQMRSGQISKDLASALGVAGMGGVGYQSSYRPSLPPGMEAGKMLPTMRTGPGENQFTQYNTGVDPANYIAKNTVQARNFQDLLTSDDYKAYQALQGLSGRDTGKAWGTSQIGPAAMVNTNYRNDLQAAHQNFMDKYTTNGVGNSYNVMATSRENDPFSGVQRSGQFDQLVNDYQQQTRAAADAGNPDVAPTIRVVGYNANVDQMINQPQAPATKDFDRYVTGGWYPEVGNWEGNKNPDYSTEAITNADNLYNSFKNELQNTNVDKIATLTDTDTQEQEQYKRFKGLL